MSDLKHLQEQMMAFIMGQPSSTDGLLKEGQGADTQTRLGIYRNNYLCALRDVLDTDFDILGRYMGDELFDPMIEGYIETCPSQYTSLRDFGNQLPQFLTETEPFKNYPQLAHLARFERALMDSFDAADRPRLARSDLMAIPQDQWPNMTLRFHPSLQRFQAPYNVVEIWQAIKAEQHPPDLTTQAAMWVLWRNAERLTEFRSASDFEQLMLNGFLSGNNLAGVAEQLAASFAPDVIAAHLVEQLFTWLDAGWVIALPTDAGTELTAV